MTDTPSPGWTEGGTIDPKAFQALPGHSAAQHAQTPQKPPTPILTASELAGMLEGWPEGARPARWGQLYLVENPHDRGCFHLLNKFSRDEPMLDELADLACMSGMRWLMGKDCPLAVALIMQGPTWLFVAHGSKDLQTHTEGRALVNPMECSSAFTFLHAIDAAIRAVGK